MPFCNDCCSGKAISIKFSECVTVALVIQHVMRMCRVILSYVACLDHPYFSKLSHKGTSFGKKNVTDHKMCDLIFSSIMSEKFVTLRRSQRVIIANMYWLSCHSCQNLMKLKFSQQIFERL